MKLNAHLDVDVVAHEADDQVDVLIDLEAPIAVPLAARPPAVLQVVLDRSGSMSGSPLEGAKRALVDLVRRLDPTDHLGVVTFDSQAQVVVPTAPLADRDAVVRRILGIQPGGTTDLSAGYLRGLREVRRALAAGASGATVLVVSDGHVNGGLRDVDRFAAVAQQAAGQGTVTTTLGYGHGYDETLLAAIARAGNGNHVFAADVDAASAAVAREVDGLLEKVVLAASLTVRFEPTVSLLRLFNDLPAQQVGPGEVMIELGDLWAGETRKLLLRLQVPAMAALGLVQVADLVLQWVELPGLVEHTAVHPISVNVVPGDEAAGRVPDPVVRSEVLFQEAQDAKRRASEAFERDDADAGRLMLDRADDLLGSALGLADGEAVPDLQRELDDVRGMRAASEHQAATYLSKVTRASYHEQNRKRGRRRDES